MADKDTGTVKIVLPSRPEYLLVARLATSGVGLRADLTVDDIEDLKVAVAEACTNVINHAFGENVKPADRVINLRMSAGRGEMTVEVEDQGRGFDPQELELVGMSIADSREGAYTVGFFLFWILFALSSSLTWLLTTDRPPRTRG